MSADVLAPANTAVPQPSAPADRDLLPDISDTRLHWQRTISRGARFVVGISVGTAAISAFGPVLAGAGGQLTVTPGSALLMLALAGIYIDLATNRPARWGVALVMLLFGAGILLTLPATIPEDYVAGDPWWPAGPTTSTLVYGVVMTRRAYRWVVFTALMSLYVYARLEYWPGGARLDWELATVLAVELGGVLMVFASVVIALAVVTRVARQLDQAMAEEAAAMQALSDKDAADRRSRAVDRFVHDEVLHVLRMIALDREAMPAREAVAGAQRLATLLDDEARPGPSDQVRVGLASRLLDVARASSLDVTLTGDDLQLPEHVEEAFAAAATEALHNVALHAGVDSARIAVTVTGESVDVLITDEGRGFALQGKDGRHGIADSIVGRMQDAGGEAAVTSRPEEGTQVRLVWAPRAERVRSRGRDSFSLVRRFYPAVVTVILPFAVGILWTEAWLAPTLGRPGAGWMSIVLIVGTFAYLAAKALRTGLSGLDSALAIAVAWLGTHLNMVAIPHSGPVALYLWISGSAIILIALVSQFRPPWEVTVMAVGISTILVGSYRLHFGWEQALTENFPTLVLPLLCLAIALTIRWILERLARAIGRSEARVLRGLEAQPEREAFRLELGRRVGRRHEAVGSFIDGVASGSEDVSSPEVRTQAALLERTIRESLFTPPEGALDEALRRAREAGLELEVRISGELPSECEEACVLALAALTGPHAPPSAQLTVTPGPEGCRLSLTASGLGRAEIRKLTRLEEQGWTLQVHDGAARAVRLVSRAQGRGPRA